MLTVAFQTRFQAEARRVVGGRRYYCVSHAQSDDLLVKVSYTSRYCYACNTEGLDAAVIHWQPRWDPYRGIWTREDFLHSLEPTPRRPVAPAEPPGRRVEPTSEEELEQMPSSIDTSDLTNPDSPLMQPYTFIKQVGVELEGGWMNMPANLGSDGSVHFDNYRDIGGPQVVGELRSKPYYKLGNLLKWIRLNHPTHTNRTCGYHIHVSFKTAGIYSRLADKKFYEEHFLPAMTDFANLMPDSRDREFLRSRIAGENNYCKRSYIGKEQLAGVTSGYESGDRYTQLNYCYARHKTLECRLFPMFSDPKITQEATITLIRLYENYLQNTPSTIYELQTDDALDTNVEEPTVVEVRGELIGVGVEESLIQAPIFEVTLSKANKTIQVL